MKPQNYVEGQKFCHLKDLPQALEVMAINHKNNASNKCLHRGLVLPGVQATF